MSDMCVCVGVWAILLKTHNTVINAQKTTSY